MKSFDLIRLHPRPGVLNIAQGNTVLSTGSDGFIQPESELGLFFHETRMISQYQWKVNGKQPQIVANSNVQQHSWLGYFMMAIPDMGSIDPDTGSGLVDPASEKTLEFTLSRYAGQGVHEDVDLINHTQQQTQFTLSLSVNADFADQIEVRSQRVQQGTLQKSWQAEEGDHYSLIFHYHASHSYEHQGNQGTKSFNRSLELRFFNADSQPVYREDQIQFEITLEPHQKWHTCVHMIPSLESEEKKPIYECYSFKGITSKVDQLREQFLDTATKFSASGDTNFAHIVVQSLEQAKRDLASLRLYELDHAEDAWTMAAGFPIYVALFGRDTLTAAWQAALLGPEMMKGTLQELSQWQGTEVNDWRDEQPGRMLHEAHTGPLEMLNFNPRRRYYGSITTSGFYPVVLSELWHWTGKKEWVQPLLQTMMRSIEWLDKYSDLDGDGFYEYKTRSTQGGKHQAWKDSRDAIVDEDGRQIEPPIATCEEQGFIYLAKIRAAELLFLMGDKGEARRLFQEAQGLKKRFNEVFWMEEGGYFAMGLDSENQQIRAIGSNPGHLLATGIADKDLVERTAKRMFDQDLFTGWGIRTLSSENPAYNPFSYHRGSVWPVEQGTFTLGFMRYGLHSMTEKLAKAVFETASLFDYYRLPEVFSGHSKDEQHPFPAFYLQTNWPQAWSASMVFNVVQSMLGLYPYAPLNLLLIDPHLPDWLPDLTIQQLRVGDAEISINFTRKEDGSSDYRVLDVQGTLHVVRQPSPWSLTADIGERFIDILQSLHPGK